jgi:hypothetical protein
LTEWSDWSACNGNCGSVGTQHRRRSNLTSAYCEHPLIESRSCNNSCECIVSEWSSWSECSKKCGSGETIRSRIILSNSVTCNYTLEEKKPCNIHCCPIDGSWSPWSEWSNCTSECNSGLRKRKRTCDSPKPYCEGSICEGPSDEVEICNSQPCGNFLILILKQNFINTTNIT